MQARPQRAASLYDVDDLYRENILDHYKHPHNWSPPAPPIDAPDLEFHDLNPLCGDELTVQLAIDAEGRVEDVRFEGANQLQHRGVGEKVRVRRRKPLDPVNLEAGTDLGLRDARVV